jgi:tetratricopeptide (TPR) repeat protein
MRALPKLLLANTLLLVMLASLTGCVRNAAYYVEQGNKLFKQGKYNDATLLYRKAIQKNPKDGEAYYRLGLVAIQSKKIGDAMAALSHAIELQPDNHDARVTIANIYLETYLLDASRPQFLYAKLTALANEFLSKDPRSFEGLRIKGYLALSDRKPADAAGYFKRAYEIRSTDEGVASSWVEALFMDSRSQEGEALGLKMIKDHPGFGSIYDRLAQHYASIDRSAESESLLRAKVANNPHNSQFALQLAAYYIHGNKAGEAEAVLKRLLDNPKDFPNARVQIGDFYYELHDWQRADGYYQEALRADSEHALAYQERITDVLLAEGKRADATQMVNTILKANQNDPVVRRVHASLLASSSASSDITNAISEFQSLIEENPGNADLSYRLGRIYLNKGDMDDARRSFERALAVRRDFLLPRYPLAQIALAQQNAQAAVRYSSEILTVLPNDPQAMLLHASGLVARGDNSLARQELMALLKQSPQDAEAQVQLGLLDIKDKRFKEAVTVFQALRQSHRDDPRALAGLAEANAAQNHPDEAYQMLTSGGAVASASPVLHQELARVALMDRKYDVAVREYSQLATQNPKSFELGIRLGEAYQLSGNLKLAIATFQNATQLAPGDAAGFLLLGDALWQANRIQEADQAYHRALQLQPNSLSAMNNLAYFLADTGTGLDEALRVAQRAVQNAPQQPGFKDTLGWVYLKQNDTNSALQVFSNLVRQYPNDPLFRYHLGVAFYKIGEKAKAKAELITALSKRPRRTDELKIREFMATIN